jgi:hypothetical protein
MRPHASETPTTGKHISSRTRQSSQGSRNKPQDLSHHEWITMRAYELYEQRGRQDDHALDDWLHAERELLVSKSAENHLLALDE